MADLVLALGGGRRGGYSRTCCWPPRRATTAFPIMANRARLEAPGTPSRFSDHTRACSVLEQGQGALGPPRGATLQPVVGPATFPVMSYWTRRAAFSVETATLTHP